MTTGLWQILLVVALILILFGRNRISGFMGDLGKGITSFKKGLNEDKDDDKPEKNTKNKSKKK